MERLIERVDRLNFAVVRLTALHQDEVLSHATGFFFAGFIEGRPNHWLVTNWHVVSGRNAQDPRRILDPMRRLPTHLMLRIILKSDDEEHKNWPGVPILFQEQTLQLYDSEGVALWAQHRRMNEIDIAVMNIAGGLGRYDIVGVNEIPQQDISIEVGNEVFILGYPLGFSHFLGTPIWKRGTIASEPHLITPDTRDRVVIDSTTRSGMSGAPVIMRYKTHYLSESGQIIEHGNAYRWLGIYASRPNLDGVDGVLPEDRSAELGFYYKAERVYEIVTDGIPGPDGGFLPGMGNGSTRTSG